MTQFDAHITACIDDLVALGYAHEFINQTVLIELGRSLGPAIYDADAAHVSCSDPAEIKRVIERFLVGKLGRTDEAMNRQVCDTVCAIYNVKRKKRVVFYYLAMREFDLVPPFSIYVSSNGTITANGDMLALEDVPGAVAEGLRDAQVLPEKIHIFYDGDQMMGFRAELESLAKEGIEQVRAARLAAADYYRFEGDQAFLPSFIVKLELSELAAQKIAESGETIIVNATFSGYPSKQHEAAAESGWLMAADSIVELKPGDTGVVFKDVSFPRSIYDALDNKDVDLLVNVYSGRRVFEDNILSSDIISGKYSTLRDLTHTLKCYLIEETIGCEAPVDCFDAATPVTFQQSGGRDQGQNDEERTHRAEINLCWPKLNIGSKQFRSAAHAWINRFQEQLLVNDNTGMTIEDAAAAFMAEHAAFSAENPDAMVGYWSVVSEYSIRYQSEAHITIQMRGYISRGGAHPSTTGATRTFDLNTGRMLTLDDMVNDKEQLKAIAEAQFRANRPDIFEEGFEFNDIFPFALPQGFGLDGAGIYMHFLPYEVAPYALGETEFTIPFEELGEISRLVDIHHTL